SAGWADARQHTCRTLCPLLLREVVTGAAQDHDLRLDVANVLDRRIAPLAAFGVFAADTRVKKRLVHHRAGGFGDDQKSPAGLLQRLLDGGEPLADMAVAYQYCCMFGLLIAEAAG